MTKIAFVQCEVIDADVERNFAVLESTLSAIRDDTDIVVFPELFLQGFLTNEEVTELALAPDSHIFRKIIDLSRINAVVIAFGFAERRDDEFYNALAWISPDGVVEIYRKNYLWLCDKDIYSPGNNNKVVEHQNLKFGLAICFDIEFPESGRAVAQQGSEVLIVSNGNMHPYGAVHRIAAQARAVENHCYVVMCNRTGHSRGRSFVGDSLVVTPHGDIVCELGTEPGIGYVEIDASVIAKSKSAYNYLECLNGLPVPSRPMNDHSGGVLSDREACTGDEQ